MTGFDEDTADNSKNRWINDTHAARRSAMEVRRRIPADMARTPCIDVPELVDYYNRMMWEYYSHIEPKAETFPDLWDHELTTVSVPENGVTIHAGTTDAFGKFPTDPIYTSDEYWSAREVNLKHLRRDWLYDNAVNYTVTMIDPSRGRVEETRRKTVQLPARAVDAVIGQLNECLDALGWLPDAGVKDYTASDDEVLRHG